jgi:hypothetical protein
MITHEFADAVSKRVYEHITEWRSKYFVNLEPEAWIVLDPRQYALLRSEAEGWLGYSPIGIVPAEYMGCPIIVAYPKDDIAGWLFGQSCIDLRGIPTP